MKIPEAGKYASNEKDSAKSGNRKAPELYEEMSPDTKRLLGLRDFPERSAEDMQRLFKSTERVAAFNNIKTVTIPQGPRVKQKQGIVSEIVERGLVSEHILKHYPTIYLGSGTQVQYPLALGARSIEMVDPTLENHEAVKELKSGIRKLIGHSPEEKDGVLNFNFDFGEGLEVVTVFINSKPYVPESTDPETYNPPNEIGVILLFAAQGPQGQIEVGESTRKKIVPGGVIVKDTELSRVNSETNEAEAFHLGK